MSTLLADAGLEKANHTVSVINTRLTDTQSDVVDLRSRIASLALVATIDPSHEPELVELRSRLAEAEAQQRELSAARQLAAGMAREAREKALLARRDSDWAEANILFDNVVTIARELDDAIATVGSLYQDLLKKQAEAVAKVQPHVSHHQAYVIQPPDLTGTMRLVLGNSGALPADPGVSLHLDAAQRDRASITGMVQHHREIVLTYRPMDTTEQEEAGHGD